METCDVQTENPTAERQRSFKVSGFVVLQLRVF